ncbi:hypothetical protein JIQ42_03236 [Leishmania sp. Namibia]|uniref:hypothetical protein n=1 Tax=Leishmania sp. Namibia TaxID=2802991 RepID=UPI001B6CFD80|nr:hypothetical protein JIQ42_03236 [Leishmania sp. Namibia]
MSTAGLSRAYAVLRQLDVLRADSITNPLPLSGDLPTCVRSEDRGVSKAVRTPSRPRGESNMRSVRLQESPPPPPAERRGQRTGCRDAFWEQTMGVGAAQLSSSPLLGATHRRSCFSAHPYAYVPVYSNLSSDSFRHDRPHQKEPPRLAAAEEGHHASAAATSAGAQSRRSPRSGEFSVNEAYDHYAPPPPSHGSGATPLHFLSPSPSPFSRHQYNTEVATEERPLRRSLSARVGVPSPVVLPSLSTSEAAHVAAAQASSTLEVCFDKDGMDAVLASVGAAAAASSALVGRTQQDGRVDRPSSAQPAVSAAGGEGAAFFTHPRSTHGVHRSTGGAADFAHGFGASANASAVAEAAAVPSSLSNSTLMAMSDGDAEPASFTSLVTAADGGRRPLRQLPMSSNDVGGKQPCRYTADAAEAASPSAGAEEFSAIPSVERLLDASPSLSRSAGQPFQRETTAAATAAPLCLLSCPPPPGDLSSFYTTAGHSARADGGRGAYTAETPQRQQQRQEKECISCGRHCRLPQRGMPSPRDGGDVAASSPRSLANRSSEKAGDDRSGCTGDNEGSNALGLNYLSAGRGEEGGVDKDADHREAESLPLCGFFGAAEEKPVQRPSADDVRQPLDTHRRSQSDSRELNVTGGGRGGPTPLLPAAYTNAVPFLDYLARVHAASSHQLLKELAAMGEAWAATTQATHEAGDGDAHPGEVIESTVVDCLAMDLLLNRPSALECMVVPWLRTRLELMMAVHLAERMSSSPNYPRDRGNAVTARALIHIEAGEGEADGVDKGNASANNNVLCAIIGLGGAAFTLLPTLLQLLLWLPPPSPTSVCDVRLVGLAIRTAGGADGLQALIRTLEQRAEGPHVLAAVAYALSTYSFELVGHTSVVCVPAGAMRRPAGSEGAAELFRLVPDGLAAAASLSATPLTEELRALWSCDPFWVSPTLTTEAPARLHLLHLQSPPPYRLTHMMVDAEVARCRLLAHLGSDQCCVAHVHPHVVVLLNDALSARLLSSVATPAAQSRYSPTLSQMRRDLHRVLADDVSSIAAAQRANGGGSDMDDQAATLQGLLRLPLLPYSLHRFFAGEKDTLFALESALVHALLARSAAALVQEQALMSLSTLPPEARVHVVQPVTDFFVRLGRTLQLRQTTTMRRPVVQAGRSGPGPCNSGGEVNADETVAVAAAIAAGTVCVNPLASSSCVKGCIASIVPVFKELLHSPLWRVRHAACVGLARIGPLTADPSSIIDALLNCIGLHPPLITEESGSSVAPSAAAIRPPQLPLQSATVVWCLAQQRQGGVRALLQLLQDPQQPPQVHHWCAFQLAEVDVHEACAELIEGESSEANALLDELVQVLGRLIATQGTLEEDTVLLCVRALAEVVHRHYTNATSPADTADAAMDAVLSLDTVQLAQEAAAYYQEEEPNACFTVLTSVAEAALLPTNVLKSLCLYLCRYGGGHGELYVCEMLLQSSSVGGRAAAAFGLRACGAKVLRSVVYGMNDDSFDVRWESFETLTSIGAAAALEVLRQRPAEQRHQVRAALRDCLLRDASRPVSRKVAETVYRALLSEESLSLQELS